MKMKMLSLVATLVCLLLFSVSAYAQEDYNKAVTSVGVQATTNGYFRVAGNFTLPCLYEVVYFDTSTDFGKAALKTILTAKSTGNSLSRIVYEQDAENICRASLVEFE